MVSISADCGGGSTGSFIWINSRLPMITVSRLLKSCATPPLSLAMVSIRWARSNSWCSRVVSVVSMRSDTRLPLGVHLARISKVRSGPGPRTS